MQKYTTFRIFSASNLHLDYISINFTVNLFVNIVNKRSTNLSKFKIFVKLVPSFVLFSFNLRKWTGSEWMISLCKISEKWCIIAWQGSKSRLKGSLGNDRRLTRVIRPRTFYSAKIKSTETHAFERILSTSTCLYFMRSHSNSCLLFAHTN